MSLYVNIAYSCWDGPFRAAEIKQTRKLISLNERAEEMAILKLFIQIWVTSGSSHRRNFVLIISSPRALLSWIKFPFLIRLWHHNEFIYQNPLSIYIFLICKGRLGQWRTFRPARDRRFDNNLEHSKGRDHCRDLGAEERWQKNNSYRNMLQGCELDSSGSR